MFLTVDRLRYWLHTADRAVDELLAGEWADWPGDAALTADEDGPPAILDRRHVLGGWVTALAGSHERGSASVLFGDVPTPLPPPATFAAVRQPPSSPRIYPGAPEARHEARRGHVRRTLPRRPGAVAPPPAACLSPVPTRPYRSGG